MFRKILGIICLLTPLSLLTCSSSTNSLIYVSSVYDGDTFIINKKIKYRLFGVDTPELNDQYNNFKLTTGIEAFYAQKAKFYASNLILDNYVKTQFISKDKYNRVVAKIFYDNKDLAIELLKQGLARIAYINVSNPKSPYYSTQFAYFEKLTNAQKYAVDSKKGFWINASDFKQIFPKA